MSFGYHSALWIKESATYGSAETMTTGYVLPITSENLTYEIDRLSTEHMRASRFRQSSEDALGLKRPGGSFSGKVPWGVEFGYLLKHLCGKVAGATTTHTYTFVDKLFAGLSIAVNKGGATYIIDGAQIQSIDFVMSLGGYVEYTCNVIGASYRVLAEVAVPSLTLETHPPYWLTHQVTFELDDVAKNLTSIEFSIANVLADADDQSYKLGSTTRVLLPAIGSEITGTLKRRHVKDSGASQGSLFWDDFIAGSAAKIEAIVAHPNEGGWSTVFTFNDVRFTGDGVNVADTGHIMEEVPFLVTDADGASTDIEVIDDNSGDPAAATGAYDGSGL
jgi:hypothetical protein